MSMPASVFAAIVGFHGPGRMAAMTLSFFVCARMAWEKETLLLVSSRAKSRRSTCLVLLHCAVSRKETDLGQGELESVLLR